MTRDKQSLKSIRYYIYPLHRYSRAINLLEIFHGQYNKYKHATHNLYFFATATKSSSCVRFGQQRHVWIWEHVKMCFVRSVQIIFRTLNRANRFGPRNYLGSIPPNTFRRSTHTADISQHEHTHSCTHPSEHWIDVYTMKTRSHENSRDFVYKLRARSDRLISFNLRGN